MPDTSILVDCSNLHVGGAVQVASSVLNEWRELPGDQRPEWLTLARIEVSTEVGRDLPGLGDSEIDTNIVTVDTYPGVLAMVPRRKAFDVCFTLFGPKVASKRAHREVLGFAEVTALYPSVSSPESAVAAARAFVRRRLKQRLARRAYSWIVETEEMRSQLVDRIGAQDERVHVVPNTVATHFIESTTTEFGRRLDRVQSALPRRTGRAGQEAVRLGYLARGLSAQEP